MEWKTYKIDLRSFNQFLQTNVPKADGIVAYEDHFVIIESEPFDQTDIDAITNYYNSLTESGEDLKLTRDVRLIQAAEVIRQDLLTIDLTNLSVIERKIMMNMTLTLDEENTLLGE